MLKKFKQLFEAAASGEPSENPNQLAELAATALLLELSQSDHDVSAQETQAIVDIAKSTFNIDDVDSWIDDASAHAEKATSLYEFTELINQYFSKEQKYQLIVSMWKVAFADGRIDRYEDHLIRKVADLIYVGHSAFIRAKHEVGVAF